MDAVLVFTPVLVAFGFTAAVTWNSFNPEVIRIRQEVKTLEAGLANLRPVQDFVAISKTQRRVIELNKQADALESSGRIRHISALHLKIASAVMSFVLYVLFWSLPGIPIPVNWTLPFPSHVTELETPVGGGQFTELATLGPVVWLSICQLVAWKVFVPSFTAFLHKRAVSNVPVPLKSQ